MSISKNLKKWNAMIVLSMASFIMVIDSTAMNVSISNLVRDLNTDISTIQTIIALYTLIMAVFMLPGAKIADIFGAKKVFLLGSILYGVGTLTAALSVNSFMLFIGWSFIEGIAASLMMPTALALISSAYEGRERTAAMSVYTSMGSIALAVGPILGGLVTTYLSWRLVFVLEVIIILIILVNWKTLFSIKAPEGNKNDKLDYIGTGISMASLFSIIAGGLQIQKNITLAVILMVFGVVMGVVLFIWLAKAKRENRPVLIDIEIFKNHAYRAVLVINLGIRIVFMGAMFLISIYLQNLARYDALKTGLTLLPLSVLIFVMSMLVIRLTKKIPAERIIAFGTIAVFAGVFYLFMIMRGSDVATAYTLLPAMVFLGIGIGCTISLTSNVGLAGIDSKYKNQASGMITTMNNLGSSLSTGVLGSVFMVSIAPNLINNLRVNFPNELGGYSSEKIVEIVKSNFDKFKESGTDILGLSNDKLLLLKDSIVSAVNKSMNTVLFIVLIISALVIYLSIRSLKKKKKLNNQSI